MLYFHSSSLVSHFCEPGLAVPENKSSDAWIWRVTSQLLNVFCATIGLAGRRYILLFLIRDNISSQQVEVMLAIVKVLCLLFPSIPDPARVPISILDCKNFLHLR